MAMLPRYQAGSLAGQHGSMSRRLYLLTVARLLGGCCGVKAWQLVCWQRKCS